MMDDLADVVSGAIGAPPSNNVLTVNVSGVGSKGDASKYDDQFNQAGQKYGVDPAVLRGVARTESSFNPHAVSHDADGKPLAHGMMQFTM